MKPYTITVLVWLISSYIYGIIAKYDSFEQLISFESSEGHEVSVFDIGIVAIAWLLGLCMLGLLWPGASEIYQQAGFGEKFLEIMVFVFSGLMMCICVYSMVVSKHFLVFSIASVIFCMISFRYGAKFYSSESEVIMNVGSKLWNVAATVVAKLKQ